MPLHFCLSPGTYPNDRICLLRKYRAGCTTARCSRLSGRTGAAPDGGGAREYPQYLLAPEISALLHYVPDLHRKMLFTTLWNTGARINEALALTRGDFSLSPPYPYVQLATLKQQGEKAARGAGRMPAGTMPHRLVPLSDPQYIAQLEMMIATLRIPLKRRNPETGRTEKVRL